MPEPVPCRAVPEPGAVARACARDACRSPQPGPPNSNGASNRALNWLGRADGARMLVADALLAGHVSVAASYLVALSANST